MRQTLTLVQLRLEHWERLERRRNLRFHRSEGEPSFRKISNSFTAKRLVVSTANEEPMARLAKALTAPEAPTPIVRAIPAIRTECSGTVARGAISSQ